MKIGISTHERESRHLLGMSWTQLNARRVIEERHKFKAAPANEPPGNGDDDEGPEGNRQRGFSLPGGNA
ncbi:hypothetical protein D3C77_613570 [compost metagenome]